jgi:hypothetical protein
MAKFLEKDFLCCMFSRPTFDNTQGELDDDMHETLFGQKTRPNPKQKVFHLQGVHIRNILKKRSHIRFIYPTTKHVITSIVKTLYKHPFDKGVTFCGFQQHCYNLWVCSQFA